VQPRRLPHLIAFLGILGALVVLGLWGSGESTAAAASAKPVKVSLPSKPMSKANAAKVEKALAPLWSKIAKAKSSPGLWVGVWDPKRGYWEKAYGKASAKGPAATTKDHLRIGSITKTFTATVILGLAAEGKLSLTGTVGQYDARLAKEFPPLKSLTIEQLLSMRSGIADFLNVPNGVVKEVVAKPKRIWKAEELIAGALKEKVKKPGTPGYSTTNYIALQLIAETVTGESLGSLIADRVTKPLGLGGTALPAPGDDSLPAPGTGNYLGKGAAAELSEDGGGMVKPGTDVSGWSLSSAQGGGAMYSTLHDLGVWAASGVGNALLPKGLAAKRFQTHKLPGAGEYGLGVQKLGAWYGHDGETYGAEALALHEPKSGDTYVIAANETSGFPLEWLGLLTKLFPSS
jgi:D-alanyl-D-alanine carboxypeptidase